MDSNRWFVEWIDGEALDVIWEGWRRDEGRVLRSLRDTEEWGELIVFEDNTLPWVASESLRLW